MSRAFPRLHVCRLLAQADRAKTGQRRGALLEQAMRQLFGSLPGVSVLDCNVRHAANTEEVDILFWNTADRKGLYFIGVPFLMECKNWGAKVDGREIVYFANTLRGRCCRDGILIASNGITGSPGKLTEAYFEIANAAREGCRILVLTRAEIEALRSTSDLVSLLKLRLTEIAVRGTKTS